MKISSETAMLDFGRDFAQKLPLPAVIELIGDVGTGKTTFTRGLAAGLGVVEPVTSPSFTISKRYAFPGGELIHYDFYRLDDPGIMRDELAETLTDPHAVVVVEWGGDVADLLPASKYRLELALDSDGNRLVNLTAPTPVKPVENPVENSVEKPVENSLSNQASTADHVAAQGPTSQEPAAAQESAAQESAV